MPSPAEKLAATKVRRKPGKVRRLTPPRRVAWLCQVRRKRDALGLSLRDVATGVGMSIAALWQIEAGCDPQLTTARKIADFFSCSTDDLWPENAGAK